MVRESTVKRPAIWFSASFMAGIAMGSFSAEKGLLTAFVIGLLVAFCIFITLFYKKVNFTAVICFLCIIAAFFYSYYTYSKRNVPDYTGYSHVIEAKILSKDKIKDEKIRYHAVNVSLDGEAIDSDILITLPSDVSLSPGDRITLTAGISKPSEVRNSKLFDYKSYLADNEIYYVVYADENNIDSVITYEESGEKGFRFIINRFKEKCVSLYGDYLSSEALGIVHAITSGDDVYIDSSTYDSYRAGGIAHVLAISGLHVGFIVLFASLITSFLKKNGVLYTVINILLVWGYIVFSGMNVSAVRAGIFFSLFSIGKALKARTDTINLLFITALIMLIFRPLLLFSASFQLSFSAVLGIGLLAPSMMLFAEKHLVFLPKNIVSSLATVISASIGVLIPLAYNFNSISPLSVIANIVIVPLFAYITVAGFLMMPAVLIGWSPLCKVIGTLINGLVYIVRVIISLLEKTGLSSIAVTSPSLIFIAAFAVLILIISIEKPLWIKKKLIPIICCIAVMLADNVIPNLGINDIYTVSFIDVGQAECSVIRTPDNKVIMIDAGTSYGTSGTADYTIIPYLLRHGITHIDYLVLSHLHSDHAGEAPAIIKGFSVGNVICAFPEEGTSELFDRIKTACTERGTSLTDFSQRSYIFIGESTVLSSLKDTSSSVGNEDSLLIKIACGNNSLLFTGDMDAKGLADLPDIDNLLILKVPHHGSDSSVTDRIRELSPLYSVILSKSGNSYSLPNDNVVNFYSSFSDVIRSDESGEIVFRFNDKLIKIQTFFKIQ